VGKLRSALAAIRRWSRREHEPSDVPPVIERIAKGVAMVASVWFALAVCWEMFGPIGSGHVAASASIAVAGENMWIWKTIAPVLTYQFDAPSGPDFYCHHPWGIFWTTAILVKIFGHHDFVCRLPACFMSALTPPLLYAIGRRIWGPVAGAIACASFVALPIALAFGNFNALEVPVIFGVLVSAWGYLKMLQRFRRRWLVVSVLGLFHAINSDWAAFFYAAPLLVFLLGRGILLNGVWFPTLDRRRFPQWWALAACVAVGILLFYLWRFSVLDQLTHLLEQGRARSAGGALPLAKVLESRAHWIELSFTPLAIFLGKLALPLLCIRLVFLRRDREIFPIAIWTMAFIQYVVFKQGADVHIFWPHYFAPYFALAMGCIAASIQGFVRWVARRFQREALLVGPIVALVFTLPVPLLILPDGITGLKSARETGGRFDEKGLLVHQDLDKVAALRSVKKELAKGTSIQVHDGMKSSWHVDWVLRKPITGGKIPMAKTTGRNQYYLADRRFILGADMKTLADHFEVRGVGPVLFVDRARKAPATGFSMTERNPSWWEWYFLQGNDPIYGVVSDPFVTWELRDHLGQTPNPPPTDPANTLEQRRIAHNVALASGDTALATRLREELERELDGRAATEYSGGTRLIGTHLAKGVVDKLYVFFVAGGPIDPDVVFDIQSTIVEPKTWSLVPSSIRSHAVGMPFDVPTPLWKAGYLYDSVSEIRPRPARSERFTGEFRTRMGGAVPVAAGHRLPTLLRLER
jgi:hypothetical protein